MGCCCSSEDDTSSKSKPVKVNKPPTADVHHPLVNNNINQVSAKINEEEEKELPNLSKGPKKNNNIDIVYTPEQMLKLSINHKNKGNEYFKLGEYKKAIEEYSKAISIEIKFERRYILFK